MKYGQKNTNAGSRGPTVACETVNWGGGGDGGTGNIPSLNRPLATGILPLVATRGLSK